MYKTLLAVAILLITTSVHAFDKWDTTEKAMFATYAALHVVDWKQTRQIAKQPERYYEINPLIGEHSSLKRVDAYMLSSFMVVTAIAYVLPKKYRTFFLVTYVVVQGSFVVHNMGVGLLF